MKKLKLLLILAVFISILGCSNEDDNSVPLPKPIASFELGKTLPEVGEPFQLVNTSLHANSYEWDFGDGNKSIEKEPTHTYLEPGSYNINLMVTGNGGINSTTKTVSVVEKPPVADFSVDKSTVDVGEAVVFNNNSENANSFLWDFGDNNTSTEFSPTHIYQKKGIYTVSLIATGKGGSQSVTKEITVEQNLEGEWEGRTIEEDENLSSASIKFSIEGETVSISRWTATTNLGYFWGMNLSKKLSDENTFYLTNEVGSLKLTFTITLESSTSGKGTFSYLGKEYKIEVKRP